MSEPTRSDSLSALVDGVGLWRIAPADGTRDVIEAATQCLVAGVDSETLGELAGASPRESQFVVEALIIAVLRELSLDHVLEEDQQEAGLRALLRRLQAGLMEPRDVASWAHRNIGHGGGSAWQPFVELDDLYDEVDQCGLDEQDLDAQLREEAEAFLRGEPSPHQGTYDWAGTSAKTPLSRLGHFFDRLRRSC